MGEAAIAYVPRSFGGMRETGGSNMTVIVAVDRDGRERILGDGDLVRDGERVRVPLTMMDGVQRAVYESTRTRRTTDTRIVDAREEAYRLRLLDDTNAWRRPAGAYPLSAGEGIACSINGRPGRLRQAQDGSPWLVCVPDEAVASPAKRRSDAIASRDAVEDAYREVQERDCNAWKRPLGSWGITK
jgi:hypothetical protein